MNGEGVSAEARDIISRLIGESLTQLARPAQPVEFTGEPAPDALLNDLNGHPHAFVIACLMDRQVTAKRAWAIPHELRIRLSTFDLGQLAGLSVEDFQKVMREPTPLHRFVDTMAKQAHSAVVRIRDTYAGDASRIWSGTPSSATIVRRFLEFDGAGPKIATMAGNILVRDFRVPVSDRCSIDISVDVHVGRVMARLGLVREGASDEEVVYAAREANPEYPGVFDLAVWDIGRMSCRPQRPDCAGCSMSDLCPRAGVAST